ncbi:synaptotagmin-like protein 3 isoform X2 [Hippoglossus hippoglossus]|uniref:synaptotagmin-like protein 3 isoform X2 n=1 Tax=Hippoglossus hippoglossus TaxID=8267 RepID=UPI00148DE2FC|nr:synaptotagmin-like protein 3 isoform X2 [Hippoglossus hippoglossus]
MDLDFLHALERERVLEVLRRDKQLRIIEEDRIRRMKYELQELRRRGAKSFTRQYGERTCARCQRPLGKFWNSGDVCHGCSHRICSRCRVGVGASGWTCTVCYAYSEVKIRSGDWFLEEKLKKFPVFTDKYETVGEKLLKTYNVLSHISVVPPTPPPHLDQHFLSRSGSLNNSKPFTKSVEDLMVSFTSHMKNISTSQNDVHADRLFVGNGRKASCFTFSTQKSMSDTEINKSSLLFKVPSLPNLFKKSKDSDQEGSSTGAEEETSFGSEFSGRKRGSKQQRRHRVRPLRERQRVRRARAVCDLQLRRLLSGDHGLRLQKSLIWKHEEEEMSPIRQSLRAAGKERQTEDDDEEEHN